MKLHLAHDFNLPPEAVTETFAILAKRGVGKTFTAKKMAEQMLKAAIAPVIVADPVGVWWGLRSSSDGKGPGLPILILGGDYGDAPLEAGAGEIVARMLVEERLSAVLDLSKFRKNEQTTFMTAFAETLYHLNRQPLHLMLDEADAFAPQKPYKGQERLLGAIEDLVRRGRARGIGVTLITQRAAVINKDVLTQAEVLIALRTIAPQDRAAIEAWIRVHGTEEQGDALMDSLPSLPVGTAWFWSPGWLDVFQRVKVDLIDTFDSSATPKAGKAAHKPKTMAEVDLAAVKDKLAQQIERAKQDDPKELRAEIARLRKELKQASAPVAAPLPKTERIEVPVLRDGQLRRLEAMAAKLGEQGQRILEAGKEIAAALGQITKAPTTRTPSAPPRSIPPPRATAVPPVVRQNRRSEKQPDTGALDGPEQRILNAIAWMESIGVQQPEQSAVAFLAGYTIGGGGFNNPKGRLRGKGLVDYLSGNRIALTEAGRELAQHSEVPLTTDELQRRVLGRLPGPESKILSVLIKRYPESIEIDDCARLTGYEPGCGGFNNPKGRLRSLGLIEYPQKGHARAKDLLFLG